MEIALIKETLNIKDNLTYIQEKLDKLKDYSELPRLLNDQEKKEVCFLVIDIKESLQEALKKTNWTYD